MLSEKNKQITRNAAERALITFGLLALVVYSAAIGYCFLTNHLIEALLVGIIVIVQGALVVHMYFAIEKKGVK